MLPSPPPPNPNAPQKHPAPNNHHHHPLSPTRQRDRAPATSEHRHHLRRRFRVRRSIDLQPPIRLHHPTDRPVGKPRDQVPRCAQSMHDLFTLAVWTPLRPIGLPNRSQAHRVRGSGRPKLPCARRTDPGANAPATRVPDRSVREMASRTDLVRPRRETACGWFRDPLADRLRKKHPFGRRPQRKRLRRILGHSKLPHDRPFVRLHPQRQRTGRSDQATSERFVTELSGQVALGQR